MTELKKTPKGTFSALLPSIFEVHFGGSSHLKRDIIWAKLLYNPLFIK